MKDNKFTYEEMESARFTDLPALAESFGHEVQARGRWHFLKDAQHIVIKNRTRYFDNYKQEWGDAITFLEDYADMSFREAMDYLHYTVIIIYVYCSPIPIKRRTGVMETDLQKVSVYISLILRHKPEICGISLDLHGWANVQELIDGINRSGKYQINEDILQQIVETDEKQRYRFNNDKTLIRANQGHSIPVDVELFERMPPDILYHGTAEKYLQSIYACGLLPQSRLYVHLSSNAETAQTVGARHGKPVVFIVFSKKLWEKGQKFYLSDNGIWLTDRIAVEYIDRMQDIETTE